MVIQKVKVPAGQSLYFTECIINNLRIKRFASFKEGILIPVTTMIAAKIPFILGGAVVVEQVFNWPGMGRLAWQASLDRDYPVIMGITIFAAVVVHIGRLSQTIVYAFVNPQTSDKGEAA